MNIVEMIGECFKESKHLRKLIKERIEGDESQIATLSSGLLAQINEIKEKSTVTFK